MRDIEKRVKLAFDAVEMPTHLKAATLASIEAHRVKAPAPSCSTEEEVESFSEDPLQRTPFVESSGVSCSKSQQHLSRKKKSFSVVGQRVGLAVAACFCLLAIGFGGYRIYTTETAYIDIDVNPSIGLGVNCFDTIVSARAYNDDGREVLDRVSLTGKSYEEALQSVLQSEEASGYLGEDSFVAVNIASSNQDQATQLEDFSTGCIERSATKNYSCSQMTQEEHLDAQSHNMGMGKYRAYLILHDLDSSITSDDCSQMTMRELRDMIASLGGDTQQLGQGQNGGAGNKPGAGQGQGQGGGQGDGAAQGSGQKNGQGKGPGEGAGQGVHGNGQGGNKGQ